jgi:hypothetical protein
METKRSLANILVLRQEDIPAELVRPFVVELRRLGISTEVHTSERRIYNGVEYYLPTALVIFITASFVRAFLSEAGKDAYAGFKRGLIELLRKSGLIKARVIYSGKFKINAESPYSRVVSIYYRDVYGRQFKFLIPVDADEAVYVEAVDALGQFLLRGRHAAAIKGPVQSNRGRQLELLTYDEKTKEWCPYNPLPGQDRHPA